MRISNFNLQMRFLSNLGILVYPNTPGRLKRLCTRFICIALSDIDRTCTIGTTSEDLRMLIFPRLWVKDQGHID